MKGGGTKMNMKVHEIILGMSHAYFEDRKATVEEIRVFVRRSKAFYSDEQINMGWLLQKLETIHLAP